MCVVKVKGGGHRRIVFGETHHHPGRTDGRLAGRRSLWTTDDGRRGRSDPVRSWRSWTERERDRETERQRDGRTDGRTEETKSGARTERREEASEGGAFLFCFVLFWVRTRVVSSSSSSCVCACERRARELNRKDE